jgi:hypothetical protein
METGMNQMNENQEEKKSKSSYTKGQRIAAMIGAVLLIAMYLVTLIAAITTSPAAPELFKMSLGASVLLPIMFWLYLRFWKLFTK